MHFIPLAFSPLSWEEIKKSSWGITWSRALHVLHSKRLRRDYPRPDVSLSKEKEKKNTSRPLRSSHILLLVSIKQQDVGCLEHHAGCL